MCSFIINFDLPKWWTVQKMAKPFYLYPFILSHFNKYNSFLRTPVTGLPVKIFQCETKYENLITNLSSSNKMVCSHRNESKTQDVIMTETRIGEIPSFLLAKRVDLLVTLFFTFICFWRLYISWKKPAKGIYPQFCSVENDDARSIFTWMSKVIRIRFWFCFSVSFFVLRHSRHLQLLVQSEVTLTNRDSLTHVTARNRKFTRNYWIRKVP